MNIQWLMINFLIDILLISAPILFLKKIEKKDWKEIPKSLGLKKIKAFALIKKTFELTLLLIIALVLVSIAVNFLSSYLGITNDITLVYSRIKEIDILFLGYLLIVRVFAEELFFRGFLVQKLGILGSTVLFAALHYTYGSFVEVIGAFVLGALLAWKFTKNQNLSPNVFSHIAYNLIIIASIFLLW